jgi:AraC-like DNA-binding protein
MVYHVNGTRVRVGRGDAIFLPPGTIRSRDAGGAVSYISFNFLPSEGVTFPFEVYMPGCITPDIRRVFSLFSQQHLSPKFHSAQKCASLLNYVLLELLDAREVGSHNEHVRKILAYIEEHGEGRITLGEMSRLVGLTPEYTATVFKRETGKTLGEYVNERKLLQAKGMIRNSTLSLQEIATRLGFENYHYFSRLFKKQSIGFFTSVFQKIKILLLFQPFAVYQSFYNLIHRPLPLNMQSSHLFRLFFPACPKER